MESKCENPKGEDRNCSKARGNSVLLKPKKKGGGDGAASTIGKGEARGEKVLDRITEGRELDLKDNSLLKALPAEEQGDSLELSKSKNDPRI